MANCDKCCKGQDHTRCLVRLHRQYFQLVEQFGVKDRAFYFQAYAEKFELKNIPLGIHSLNKIVPLLCDKASLERRTSDCLNVTCASRLFNENEKEELIRSRSGHTSDALFRYEKANKEQELKVLKLSGPLEPDEDVRVKNKSGILPEKLK